jgi:anion-transporting  ArsA/GET3 family ATPase
MPGSEQHAAVRSRLGTSLGIESVPSPVRALGDKRFLFVTGKGGVGKTTVCASLALAMAKQGKRVLVAMCNTKERLSAMLGTAPIGDHVVSLAPNVFGVNISPDVALAEYGELILKVKTLTAAVFDSKMMKTFFRAVPGLYEWAMLGKAWFHTTETRPDGSWAYDVVLLDAPATGHGLDMLRVPKVILDIVPPGILRRDAERAWELFRDPTKSGVIAVTLAEELPVTETIELCTAIDKELGLPLTQLFVNAVVDPLFADDARSSLVALEDLLDPKAPIAAATPAERAVVAGARRALRERVQEDSVRRLLASVKLPAAILPHLYDEASTPQGTKRLAAHLGAATIDGRA